MKRKKIDVLINDNWKEKKIEELKNTLINYTSIQK